MACVKAGDWRRALDLLAGMKVEGITPDILSHNSVISACAKGGQWRIGLELLAKVQVGLYMLTPILSVAPTPVLCERTIWGVCCEIWITPFRNSIFFSPIPLSTEAAVDLGVCYWLLLDDARLVRRHLCGLSESGL